MASRFEISGITDQLYDSLLQRRKAVEFEKNLLFQMQKHRDEMAYKYAALAKSGSRGVGSSGRSAPQVPQVSPGRASDSEQARRTTYEADPEPQPAWEMVSTVYGPDGVSYNNMQNTSTGQIAQVPTSPRSGRPAPAPVDPRNEAYDTLADRLGTN